MKKDFVCQEDHDHRIVSQKKLPKGGDQTDHRLGCNLKLLDSPGASLYISEKEYRGYSHERLYQSNEGRFRPEPVETVEDPASPGDVRL